MVDLQQAKEHLRIDHDHEDGLIQGYIDAATEAAFDYMNWDEPPIPLPAPVISAVLLVVADLYENRQYHIDARQVKNQAYAMLLNPYRNMGV